MNQARLLAIAPSSPQLQISWSNYDGTSSIYITNDATLNQVSLALTNQLGQQLSLQAGTPVAFGSNTNTGSQSTLYIFFAGMLSNAEVEAIQMASTSSPTWQLKSFTDSNGLAYLAMSPQTAISIPNGGSLTIPLTNLLARSTDFSGNVSIAVVTGANEVDAQVFVNVQNPPVTTNQELELLVGFAGTDLVFTGSQPNTLTLYLTNPQSVPLVPGGRKSWGPEPPSFQLSLVFGSGAGSLTSVANADNVVVNLGNTFGNDYDAVAKQSQGAAPIWKIQPSGSGNGLVLGTGENATITLSLTEIIAAQPQGLTYAYLSYSNIPGYNDGYYGIEIVKGNPIVISSFTASPDSLTSATGPTLVTLSFEVQNAGYVTITNTDYTYSKTGPAHEHVDTVTVTAYATTIYTLIASNYATGQVVSKSLVLTVSAPDLLATSFTAGSASITNSLVVNGNVGVGVTTPAQLLDVNGGILARSWSAISAQGAYLQWNRSNHDGETWLINQQVGGTGSIRFGSSDQSNNTTEWARFDSNGNLGLNITTPAQLLDVNGGILARSWSAISAQGAYLQWNRSTWEGETWLINQRGGGTGSIRFGSSDQSNNTTEWARFDSNGNLGLNITTPAQLLDVNGNAVFRGHVGIGVDSGATHPNVPLVITSASTRYINNGYFYVNSDGFGNGIGGGSYPFNTSMYSEGDIIANTFRAFSDSRLKTIIGRSDHAADLALLQSLRITNYTMRDRVQHGEQTFKKIIAQELEEVFPQAVRHHTDFLPDIYARPSQLQRQGEELRITLPAGLPQAAQAGQRLKLIGPTGEVVATLTRAVEAGSEQLLVSGATSLAETPEEVFVFGLEHADARSVDYDAVAMLNVSATQALALQVEELRQQNATLHEQCRTQGAQLGEMQAALHALQQQVAALLSHSNSSRH